MKAPTVKSNLVNAYSLDTLLQMLPKEGIPWNQNHLFWTLLTNWYVFSLTNTFINKCAKFKPQFHLCRSLTPGHLMVTPTSKNIQFRTNFAKIFNDCKFKAIATAAEATTRMKTQTTSFTSLEYSEFSTMKARFKQIKNSLKIRIVAPTIE